jgi:hypothetical protein
MLNSRLAREFGRAVNKRQYWFQLSLHFLIGHAIVAGGLGLMNFKVDHLKSPLLWFAGGGGAVVLLEALAGLRRREVVPYNRGYEPPQADPRELAEPGTQTQYDKHRTPDPEPSPEPQVVAQTCPVCSGRGYDSRMVRTLYDSNKEYEVMDDCFHCNGTGTVYSSK